MEYKNLKRYGNKNIKVTLNDGNIIQGQFISYLTNTNNSELVERLTLVEESNIEYVFTKDIKSIEFISLITKQ